VPQDSGASRVFEVSQSAVRIIVSLVVTGVALLLLVGIAAVSRGVDVAEHQELEEENHLLVTELGRIETRLGILDDTVGALERREPLIRLLANLEPLDPAVHEAGIGGPEVAQPIREEFPVEGRARALRADLGALTRRANLLAWSFREAAESLRAHTARLEAMPSIMPTQGWLSSAFTSMRAHPVLHVARPHQGIDVTAPAGTPIEAPAAGTVVKAGWETGYGLLVVIDHGYGIVTRYAHASRLTVRAGRRVQRGDVIAHVGRTGLAVGPHLHYEVHVNGQPVNPLRFVLPTVVAD